MSQAATKALHLDTPAFLDPGLVHPMVDAALAAHDTVIHYTEPNLHRQTWEDVSTARRRPQWIGSPGHSDRGG
ncbi:hypothetical protein [Nonomuraea candida]|uniref:hypothetical protein n=1 Tax=Nonomuraea candida TaxID=359159 RepID=UPI0005BE8472|nr:hypothetical protein [Nonomuraea candida]